jgi:hypothetical protein
MEPVGKLLLFAATTGYQIREFADAGRRLGIDVVLATDRCHQMDDPWADGALAVKFDGRMAESLQALRGLACAGVAAVGDDPFHPPAATRSRRPATPPRPPSAIATASSFKIDA